MTRTRNTPARRLTHRTKQPATFTVEPGGPTTSRHVEFVAPYVAGVPKSPPARQQSTSHPSPSTEARSTRQPMTHTHMSFDYPVTIMFSQTNRYLHIVYMYLACRVVPRLLGRKTIPTICKFWMFHPVVCSSCWGVTWIFALQSILRLSLVAKRELGFAQMGGGGEVIYWG